MSIRVKSLTKVFGQQRAVNNINFEVNEGEILGFLGPNGAGKSTTMKIATCYLPPSEGTIEICGEDVRNNSIGVRRNIGYLPEHNPLYLDMYVHEFLNFAGSIHIKKSSERKKSIGDIIEKCGLTKEQNKKIGALSKGYRQRVGLAQALLHDPKVLILDEPTTGLDPNQIIEIRNLIKTSSKNKTVIFSTHIMQEVQALCDRVIIINKGEIVANATPDELKKVNTSPKLVVQFDKEIDLIHFTDKIKADKIEPLNDNRYRIFQDGSVDIRPAIYQYSTEQKLTLLQLTEEESNMEDIFRLLTNKNQ